MVQAAPQHRTCNACQLFHRYGLACSAFARHYLRNHGCFLFLWVLRCFTSPRSLLLPYVFRQRSPDITPVSFEVSLFGDPRIEARLPAPRGLSQVTTSFIGSWCLGIHRLPLVACCYYKDARVHCEVLNIRAGSRGRHYQVPTAGPLEDRLPASFDTVLETHCAFRRETTEPSEPNSVLGLRRGASRGSTPDSKSFEPSCTDDESTTLPTSQCSTSGACSAADFLAADPSAGQIRRSANWLLRKEVIQPHLPVRLPCYDLVLIASPTFDGSLPKGLGHRLRVLPTFMT